MRVLIAGASPIGRQLLTNLTRQRGHEVAIVDWDEGRCTELSEEHDAFVVHGDATDPDILDKAQISDADAVVAATSADPVNTVIAMLAHRNGVQRIIVTVTTNAMRGALREIGVTDIIAPTMAAAAQIGTSLHGAEHTNELAEMLQEHLQLVEMHVGGNADGTTLGDHALPDDVLAIAHLRDSDMALAGPATDLREDDVVIALASDEKAARKAHAALQ